MTFQELQAANAEIVFTDIKGKSYAEVHQRVKAFRKVFPEGFIQTEIMHMQEGVVVIKATVGAFTPAGVPVVFGTGHAYEKEGSNNINRTSYIENAETSAVGRALGFMGFGIDSAVASYEEIENARLNDISRQKIDELKVKSLMAKCENDGVNPEVINSLYKVEKFEDLTERQLGNIIEHWDKIKAR